LEIRLAQADSGRASFQKLLFLVRDWQNPDEVGNLMECELKKCYFLAAWDIDKVSTNNCGFLLNFLDLYKHDVI